MCMSVSPNLCVSCAFSFFLIVCLFCPTLVCLFVRLVLVARLFSNESDKEGVWI